MDFLAMLIVDVLLILSDDAQMQKALDAKTPVEASTVAATVTAVTTSTSAGTATELVTATDATPSATNVTHTKETK